MISIETVSGKNPSILAVCYNCASINEGPPTTFYEATGNEDSEKNKALYASQDHLKTYPGHDVVIAIVMLGLRPTVKK